MLSREGDGTEFDYVKTGKRQKLVLLFCYVSGFRRCDYELCSGLTKLLGLGDF